MENKKWLFSGLLVSVVGLFYISLIVFDDSLILELTREDGFYELIGAVFFLLASVLFMISYFKDPRGNDFMVFKLKKNIFYLFLGILFFFAFGEEISWGQRIFNVSTPESFKEMNVQKELNIHNLSIFHGVDAEGQRKSFWALFLNIDRLFSLFWLSFCVLIPVLYNTNQRLRSLLASFNIPVIPVWIGIFFLGNYFMSKIAETYLASSAIQPYVTEIKESLFAFLFFTVSLWLLMKLKKTESTALKN